MEAAFRAEGKQLTHLIGPGVEHRYEPGVLKELLKRLYAVHDDLEQKIANDDGAPLPPRDSYLQTRTLRYGYGAGSVQLLGLERHWNDARMDRRTVYRKDGEDNVLTTKNVSAFQMVIFNNGTCTIDGQKFKIDVPETNVITGHHVFTKGKDGWKETGFPFDVSRKLPGLQGPIDDAFLDPFVIVLPSGQSKSPLVQRWVDFEIKHFVDRWRALMRGEPRMVKDTDLPEDAGAEDELFRRCNLICFGDPDSNQVIRAAFEKLPVTWKEDRVVAGKQSWPARSHVPVLIYPDPFVDPNPQQFQSPYGEFTDRHRYLVINSGLTFREAHDKTNSQQNPKLPDWAVIDLTQLPDDKAPGRIAAAGFFDEEWKYQEHADQ
jgi:hypothetical protein